MKGRAGMKIKRFLVHFLIVFAVTFVVNAVVVYLWNLVVHGQGIFNWETSFLFAIILGIILSITRDTKSKGK